jgi:acyl-coenzyme A synthetase/AMP-(fatty) acid ligase
LEEPQYESERAEFNQRTAGDLDHSMIVERIYEWAKSQPHRPALIWNDISLTYLLFSNAIQTTCDLLRRENLPVGGDALVLVQSLADAWIIVMSLRALGLNTVCIRSNEKPESLVIAGVACVVTTETEAATYAVLTKSSGNRKAVVIPSPLHSSNKNQELLHLHSDRPPFGGHILYTSGTTGTYKKIFMNGEFENRRNEIRAQFYSCNKNTIYHGVDFELWTGTGFKTCSALWQVGGCVVLDERKENFQNFFAHEVHFTKLLPWQLSRLLAQPREQLARPVPGFAISVGGGFLPSDLAERCIKELTDNLSINFSSTELNSIRLHAEFGAKDDWYWLIPTDEKRVQIVDDSGAECLVNREGELRILLADIDCHEYLNDAEASARMFRDGFFYPGDIAVKRDDGRVRILGRLSDVVVLKGEKVATAPLEHEIQQMLGVEEVCLFSGLNSKGEEALVIAIQWQHGIPKSKLEGVAAKFPRFEKVRFLIRREFPRLSGSRRKINRTLLKKLVFEELDKHS